MMKSERSRQDAGVDCERGLRVYLPLNMSTTCFVAEREVAFVRGSASDVRKWSQLPANPLIPGSKRNRCEDPSSTFTSGDLVAATTSGSVQKTTTVDAAGDASRRKRKQRDTSDWPFMCDACQKAFRTEESYTAHMDLHVYCDVPGCKFTCRRDKLFRMEEHKELLHNRPDAPDLIDMSKYLGQRKRRFPTQDRVRCKVEELYYRAARGMVMPEEERRWMGQHGIQIGRRGRSGQTFIAGGTLPSNEDGAAPQPTSAPATVGKGEGEITPHSMHARSRSSSRDSSSHSCETTDSSSEGDTDDDIASSIQVPPPATLIKTVEVLPPTSRQTAPTAGRRAPPRDAVPRFYVCNRCGTKGSHFEVACPTLGDTAFDRPGAVPPTKGKCFCADSDFKHNQPQISQPTESETLHPATTVDATANEAPSAPHHREDEDSEDGGPPPAVSARGVPRESNQQTAHSSDSTAPSERPEKEVTRMYAPVAAAKRAKKSSETGARRGGRGMLPPAQTPTLYERLTEEERLNERGLLLQAMRFFVARNYLH